MIRVEVRVEGRKRGNVLVIADCGQVKRLGKHEDAGQEDRVTRGRLMSKNPDPPGLRKEEAGEELEQGRLPGSVQTEQTVDVAGLKREIQFFEDGPLAVAESDAFHFHHDSLHGMNG